MANYSVRSLRSDDFGTLMTLEQRIFGEEPPGVLGPYYVRMCCDVYGDTCFLALDGEVPVAYVLCFVRGREAHCTTLAVVPEYQGSRVVALLLRAFVRRIIDAVDTCWFTVTPDNTAARALHATLGAQEVAICNDYYGPGDTRILSCVDAKRFELLRTRYQRLGLVAPRELALEAAQ
ncbi:MAG: GNAT family N-acetyltransferase [Deltaproteobacteria bacterium]|nr:GNAT family N-acetyltransferase [Nannocystaceae bacterium]